MDKDDDDQRNEKGSVVPRHDGVGMFGVPFSGCILGSCNVLFSLLSLSRASSHLHDSLVCFPRRFNLVNRHGIKLSLHPTIPNISFHPWLMQSPEADVSCAIKPSSP